MKKFGQYERASGEQPQTDESGQRKYRRFEKIVALI